MGTIAAFVAVAAIRTNRSIARTKATLDLIERTESQQYYQDLHVQFKEVRTEPNGFDQLIKPTNAALRKQRTAILSYLNHYELIAVGVKHGVLDKNFYGDYMRGSMIRDFKEAKYFIEKLRNPPGEPPQPTYFQQFQRLAEQYMVEEEYERSFALAAAEADEKQKKLMADLQKLREELAVEAEQRVAEARNEAPASPRSAARTILRWLLRNMT